jgi:hypothetical protein
MRRRGGLHILTLKWSGSPEKTLGEGHHRTTENVGELSGSIGVTWRGAKVLFVEVDVDPRGRREGAQDALQLAYLVLLGLDEDECR